jgi:hypothetical protein
VESRRDCTWILGLSGFRVVTADSEGETAESRLTIRVKRRGVRRYECSGCGRRTSRVRSARERRWDDVPWASRPVTLVYTQRGSDVGTAGFAPNVSSSPMRRRGSRGACGKRSAWTVSRCQPRMRRSATALVGAKRVERSTRSCASGTASVLDVGRAIWGPMRFIVARRRSFTPGCRTSCTAR